MFSYVNKVTSKSDCVILHFQQWYMRVPFPPHPLQNLIFTGYGHFNRYAVPSCEASWTVAHQAPLSLEFSRQEYWSGLPLPIPGYLPDSEIKPGSPALPTDSLPLSHLRSSAERCVLSCSVMSDSLQHHGL